MNVCLACKFASEVSIFVNFSISNFFLCDSPATFFLVLTHYLHYCVALFKHGDIRARDVGATCWSFRAIAWKHLYLWCKHGLLCVVAVFACFVVVFCLFCCCRCFFSFFFRDRDMISIGTVEFRYYVVIIILANKL